MLKRPQPTMQSLVEMLELALVETLHTLGVSEAASQRLLERTLDPDGPEGQFFATCDIRADLRQARKALQAAQQGLAALTVPAPVLEDKDMPRLRYLPRC